MKEEVLATIGKLENGVLRMSSEARENCGNLLQSLRSVRTIIINEL